MKKTTSPLPSTETKPTPKKKKTYIKPELKPYVPKEDIKHS